MDLDDLEPFSSSTEESSNSKATLQSLSLEDDHPSTFGLLGESSDPLDIAFPELESSIHTLKPIRSNAKGKARMTEDTFDHDSSGSSSVHSSGASFVGSHKSPSSISSSIASTSFGTPTSFPITRNQGYQDDRPPFGLDKLLSHPSFEQYSEEGTNRQTNPYYDFRSELISTNSSSIVSSPRAGPSSPFSSISSSDRSFWDQFELDSANGKIFPCRHALTALLTTYYDS